MCNHAAEEGNAQEPLKTGATSIPSLHAVMQVRGGEPRGHLADLSADGFSMASSKPIPVNTDYRNRIDLPVDASQIAFMVFTACSKWSRAHRIDRALCRTGFEIVKMDPKAGEALELSSDRCGSTRTGRESKTDFLWRD